MKKKKHYSQVRELTGSLNLPGDQLLQGTLAGAQLVEYGQDLLPIPIHVAHLLGGVLLPVEPRHPPDNVQLGLDEHVVRGGTEARTQLVDEVDHVPDTARVDPVVDGVQGEVLVLGHLRVGEHVLAGDAPPVRLQCLGLDGNHQATAALLPAKECRQVGSVLLQQDNGQWIGGLVS